MDQQARNAGNAALQHQFANLMGVVQEEHQLFQAAKD
jgi:hypothetical protein